MRTTIDLPEGLLRRAKSEAALRGMKLKDFVSESLRAALDGRMHLAERAPEYGDRGAQRLAEDCVFPLIQGPGGPDLRDLTPEHLHEILEKEELERISPPPDSR